MTVKIDQTYAALKKRYHQNKKESRAKMMAAMVMVKNKKPLKQTPRR